MAGRLQAELRPFSTDFFAILYNRSRTAAISAAASCLRLHFFSSRRKASAAKPPHPVPHLQCGYCDAAALVFPAPAIQPGPFCIFGYPAAEKPGCAAPAPKRTGHIPKPGYYQKAKDFSRFDRNRPFSRPASLSIRQIFRRARGRLYMNLRQPPYQIHKETLE